MDKISKKEQRTRKLAILKVFCEGQPPVDALRNEDWDILQNWIGANLKPQFQYATAISIMDAADLIAESQVGNGLEEME